jgi:hypothetical protein
MAVRGRTRGAGRAVAPPSTVIHLNNYINIGIYRKKYQFHPFFVKIS